MTTYGPWLPDIIRGRRVVNLALPGDRWEGETRARTPEEAQSDDGSVDRRPNSPPGLPSPTPTFLAPPSPAQTLPAERTHAMPQKLPANAIVHGECRQWWTGISRAHCPACHITFSSDAAANKHRVGKPGVDRRCLAPAEAGLVPHEATWGTYWSGPGVDGDSAWFKSADAA